MHCQACGYECPNCHDDEFYENHTIMTAESTVKGAVKDAVNTLQNLLDHWDEYSPGRIRGGLRDTISEILQPALAMKPIK